MRPSVPLDPSGRDLYRFAQSLGDIVLSKLLLNRDIGASETRVAHGLGRQPVGWFELSPPSGGDRVEQTRAPDETYLYLAASAPFTANLVVL